MTNKFLLITLSILLSQSLLIAENITIDGKSDEKSWDQAIIFSTFYEVFPLTRKESALPTFAKFYSTDQGIYIFVENLGQTKLIKSVGAEDSLPVSEAIQLNIESEGQNKRAYWFRVSLGENGPIKADGIFDGNDLSTNWDANWQVATKVTPNGWVAEIFIPFSQLRLNASGGKAMPIGVNIARRRSSDNYWISMTSYGLRESNYLASLKRIPIDQAKVSKTTYRLHALTYTLNHDDIRSNQQEAGIDIDWQVGIGKQIRAAIFPDFAAAEADNVVIDFGAIELFFPEQRQFFTNLPFGIDGRTRFVHTRRIGSNPDFDCESYGADKNWSNDTVDSCENYADENTQPNPILLTGQANLQLGSNQFTALVAFEDDVDYSEGKSFVATRWQKVIDTTQLSFMSTFVDRPVYGYDASVNVASFQSDLGEYQFGGYAAQSQVDGEIGRGLRFEAKYTDSSDSLELGLTHYNFDETYNPNDFGYNPRNDLVETILTIRKNHRFTSGTTIQQISYGVFPSFLQNHSGESLYQKFDSFFNLQFSDSSRLFANIWGNSAGFSDTFTQGSETASWMPIESKVHLFMGYRSSPLVALVWEARTLFGSDDEGSFAEDSCLEGKLNYKTQILITSIAHRACQNSHNRIYDSTASDNLDINDIINVWHRRTDSVELSFEIVPNPAHRLNLSLQTKDSNGEWIQGYQIQANRRLVAINQGRSIKTKVTSLQARYHYSPGEQLDIYTVLSFFDSEWDSEYQKDTSNLSSISHEESSQFTVKANWTFGG